MGDAQPALGAQHTPPRSQRDCGAAVWGCPPQCDWSKHSQLQILGRISPWKQGKKNPTKFRISSLNPIQEQMRASPAPGSLALPRLGLAALGMS